MRGRSISIDGQERTIELAANGDRFEVRLDADRTELQIVEQSSRELVLLIGGRRRVVPFFRDGEQIHFNLGGETWVAETTSPLSRKKREKEHSLGAPMPGTVLKIHVTVGDQVARGATLITLEAMKMEHQIIAPHDGVVATIDCAEGTMVQPGVDLISVDPAS